jgi:hypothetical protein
MRWSKKRLCGSGRKIERESSITTVISRLPSQPAGQDRISELISFDYWDDAMRWPADSPAYFEHESKSKHFLRTWWLYLCVLLATRRTFWSSITKRAVICELSSTCACSATVRTRNAGRGMHCRIYKCDLGSLDPAAVSTSRYSRHFLNGPASRRNPQGWMHLHISARA